MIYEKKKTRSSRAAISRPTTHPLLQPRRIEQHQQPLRSNQQCLTAPTTPSATRLWPEGSVDPIARPNSSIGYHHQHDSPSTMQDSAENEETYETRNLADFIGQDLPKVGEISRSERLYFIGTEFSNLNYLVRHRALRMDQKMFCTLGPVALPGKFLLCLRKL